MANKRMISKSISTSMRWNGLKSDTARLLFVMTIPHCDDWGRIDGEPEVLKSIVFPMIRAYNIQKLTKDLKDLAESNMVFWYSIDNKKVVEIIDWFGHQSISDNKRSKSKFPPVPDNPQESPGFSWQSQTNSSQGNLVKLKLTDEQKYSKEAEGVYDYYISKLNPEHKTKGRACKHIDNLLLGNAAPLLKTCIDNYAKKNTDAKYRDDPANFFGQKGTWEGYKQTFTHATTTIKPFQAPPDPSKADREKSAAIVGDTINNLKNHPSPTPQK